MSFLDKIGDVAGKIGDTASNIAEDIGDKTSTSIEIGKLNSRISTERTAENAAIMELGKYYYNKFRAGETLPDEKAMELCRSAKAHNDEIANLNNEITMIKNAADAK